MTEKLRHVGSLRGRWLALAAQAAGVSLIAAACSASAPSASDGSGDISFQPSSGGRQNGGGDDLATIDGQGGGAPLPEEVEDETSFRAPVVTGSYLWSSNPESGRIALIDARDSSVRLLSAGLRPTEIFSFPGDVDRPRALVQNRGSSDASLLELVGSSIRETRISTPDFINRWAISDGGIWGVAFAVPEADRALDPTEGLQEIGVVNFEHLEEPVVRLTVGYRPRAVVLGEGRAVVVCQDGLAVLRLGAQVFVESWIDLGEGGGLDTSVTSDARRALVRRSGSEVLEVLDVDSPEDAAQIVMASPVTDLDLLPSGRVVAVARDAGEVLTFSLEDGTGGPEDLARVRISDATVGSAVVAASGRRAILYTTAVAERKLTVLDLSSAEALLDSRTIEIQHDIRGVAASPDGRFGIVFGDGSELGRGVFSILRLDEERFPRVVGTGAPVVAVALSNSGLLVSTDSGSVFEAYRGRFPELTAERSALASRPLSIGILDSEALGYVAQYHPEGRVTFFGIRSDEVRSVSGYELSAEVIEE